jgi:hypothetical protein
MSRHYRGKKTPSCRLPIRRTGIDLLGYRLREDHICDRDWGFSRILYFATHQNLGSTFRSFEKSLLPTWVCAILMDQMTPASTTPFIRSARLHRLLLQYVPLNSCSRSRRGIKIWCLNPLSTALLLSPLHIRNHIKLDGSKRMALTS